MTSTVGSPLRHALHLALAYRPSTGSSPREFAPPESALGASLCRPTLAFQFEFPLPRTTYKVSLKESKLSAQRVACSHPNRRLRMTVVKSSPSVTAASRFAETSLPQARMATPYIFLWC